MDDILAAIYPEINAGGFARSDGTIEFYGRINALLEPEMTVVDLGAGRGCQFEDTCRYRRKIATIKGKVGRVIGLDVDSAVLQNEFVDERHVYDGQRMPLADACADVIFCDWVLEHILDADVFATEIDRVLKPGGWFCARTPSRLSMIATASRLVPNRLHSRALESIQAGRRKSEDVFPAHYRLNTFGAIGRHFPAPTWKNCSYTISPAPSYHFGKPLVARMMAAVQYLKRPIIGGEVLLVFAHKTPHRAAN